MPSIETLVSILGIAMTVISVLGGIVWSMLRKEAESHAEQISKKVDIDHLKESEDRWKSELVQVKENNERLIDKLERRHDREISELGHRLSEAIRTSETNILSQLQMMLRMLDKAQQ